MKITDIKKQVKVASRYSIFIDGKFAFGLSETGLLDSGINIGQEVNSSQLDSLKKLSATDKLYSLVLNLIARRPRSQREINDYLARKTDDKAEITKLLNKLSNLKLIDDFDFAKRWVDNRRLLKSSSRRKLALELRQKGIDSNIIKKVLDDDQTDESALIKQIIAKKRSQTRYQDDQKLIAYLARQGFGYNDIKTALSEQ